MSFNNMVWWIFPALFGGFTLFRSTATQGAVMRQNAINQQTFGGAYPTGRASPATWRRVVIDMDNKKFNGWFQQKGLVDTVVTMIGIESSFGANRVRENPMNLRDWSYGVLQVTMHPNGKSDRAIDELLNRGLIAKRPTKTELTSTYYGLWYGMLYIKVLWDNYGARTPEQIARAFNGGSGWNRTEAGRRLTTAYWNKYQTIYNQNVRGLA